jgi:hypothetical protein
MRADVPGDRRSRGEGGRQRHHQPAVLNPRLCKALIDRLADQAHIIITGEDYYRFRRTTAQRKGSKP